MTVQKISYADLLEQFGEDRFRAWYTNLYEAIWFYIDAIGLAEHAQIDRHALSTCLLDFLDDINRIKDFHKIQTVNFAKICSYFAYWFLRHHPVYLFGYDGDDEEYHNERIAVLFMLLWIERDCRLGCMTEGVKTFADNLFYYMQYRVLTPQVFELALVAWNSSNSDKKNGEAMTC